jgi:hypothetical protein
MGIILIKGMPRVRGPSARINWVRILLFALTYTKPALMLWKSDSRATRADSRLRSGMRIWIVHIVASRNMTACT